MTRSVIRRMVWRSRPQFEKPVLYCRVCEECAERSEPDADPLVAGDWALAHSARNPSHNSYCEEVTRYWATEMDGPA